MEEGTMQMQLIREKALHTLRIYPVFEYYMRVVCSLPCSPFHI